MSVAEIPHAVTEAPAVQGPVILPLSIVSRKTSELSSQKDNGKLIDPNVTSQALSLVDQANKLLDGGLHRCQHWNEAKDLYFHAGAVFAQNGQHEEAATAFNHAAGICRFLGTDHEVANVVGFAVDSLQFSDPLQAAATLREQADTYVKHEHWAQAAKCEKDAGEIHERTGNNEEALARFTRAVELYSKARNVDSMQRYCEVRVRHLTVATGRFPEAAALYEKLARNHTPGIPPTDAFMLCVLSYLADASGDQFGSGVPRAKRKFNEFQDEDEHLRKGKEYELLRAMVTGFDTPSLAIVDAGIEKYRGCALIKNLATFDILALKCRDNLFQVLIKYT